VDRSLNYGVSIKSRLTGLAKRVPHLDALINVATGLGTSRDKNSYLAFMDTPPLDVGTLEALYANVSLAKRIVDSLVDDAMREGFSLVREDSNPEDDKEAAKAIMDRWQELQAGEQRFLRGAKWGRLFGGGGLILGVEAGGGGLISELDDGNVTEVRYLFDWNRQEMTVSKFDSQGLPLIYLWTPDRPGVTNISQVPIHRSRIIFFPGASTTAKRRKQNDGWDLSVLQAVYEALVSYQGMWASTDAMFASASQAVMHIGGLIQSLAEDGGGPNDVKTRLSLMALSLATNNMLVLDAGDENGNNREDYKTVDRPTLGGLDGVQQNYMTRISGDAETPETILFGISPGGDTATGKSERMMWFGKVDSYRRNVLEPALLRIIRMLARELDREEPERWQISWPELEKMDPMDAATATKMNIDSAVGLINAQAVLPEEVALSLRKLAPMLHLQVNAEARIKALEAGLAEVEAREMGAGMMELESELNAKNAAPAGTTPAPKAGKRSQTSKAQGRQAK
jgi:uncharacterized protein